MWNHKSNDRIHEWKEFRKSLDLLSLADALAQTAHKWSYAPMVGHHIDYSQVSSFPPPWELVLADGFDDTGKVLGMLYTIFLTTHGANISVQFQVLKDGSSIGPIPVVNVNDGQYILNYEFDEVVSKEQLEPGCKILHSYNADALQLSKF